MLQTQRRLRAALQIAADEAVFLNSHVQRGGAGFIDRCGAVLLGQRENAEDAAHSDLALLAVDGVAESADVRPGAARSPQHLRSAQWCSLGMVLFFDAIPSALLAYVFAQKLPGLGIEQTHVQLIPLHAQHAPDPAGRRAVVGGFDFDAAIEMHDALAVLVIAKRLQRQRQQRGFLFGKHGGDLPLGGAVNACVGPALLPVIEVGLGFFQSLEAQAFQRCFLRMADTGFDFAFAVGKMCIRDRFGRPAKGNDKGNVEGLVGYARRNFLVPIPRVGSWEELNVRLLEQCRERRARRLRGHQETIGERLEGDRAAFLPLPASAYEACEKRVARVSSMSLVRYRTNDYSVPTEYGHHDVLAKGYVHEVVIVCGSKVIARHRRSYQREDMVFDPLHYLALLEQKIRGLDQAAPLAGWELPECFARLRRLLEARLNKGGKREYVQVLRLLETFSLPEVEAAIVDALQLGTLSFDAVKHLLLCRIERRPPRLDLENYPHLPLADVQTTQAADYMTLLSASPLGLPSEVTR